MDKRYLFQVRRHLTCSTAARRRSMAQAEQMVESFMQENPGADLSALVAAFGSPEEFALQVQATLEPEEVEGGRRCRRVLVRVLTCCVIVLGMLMAGWGYLYWHPEQRVSVVMSAGVRYPQITFRHASGFDMPISAKLTLQSLNFNEAMGGYVHYLYHLYGNNYTLDYRLEHDSHGTAVVFTGQGTLADGTVEPIDERMEFDIVLRRDAKWN